MDEFASTSERMPTYLALLTTLELMTSSLSMTGAFQNTKRELARLDPYLLRLTKSRRVLHSRD